MSDDIIVGMLNTEKYDNLPRWDETHNAEYRYRAVGFLMQHFDTVKKRTR